MPSEETEDASLLMLSLLDGLCLAIVSPGSSTGAEDAKRTLAGTVSLALSGAGSPQHGTKNV